MSLNWKQQARLCDHGSLGPLCLSEVVRIVSSFTQMQELKMTSFLIANHMRDYCTNCQNMDFPQTLSTQPLYGQCGHQGENDKSFLLPLGSPQVNLWHIAQHMTHGLVDIWPLKWDRRLDTQREGLCRVWLCLGNVLSFNVEGRDLTLKGSEERKEGPVPEEGVDERA